MSTHSIHRRSIALFLVLAGVFLLATVACQQARIPRETSQEKSTNPSITFNPPTNTITSKPSLSATSIPSQSASPSQTTRPTKTITPTDTPTSTANSIPLPTLTPSLTPTYSILRGTVLEQANCRYGPGAAYLYKYGLYPGNNIEIIGRNETGKWIVIQAIGGKNPCWVKASLLDIKGDVMSLAPAELPLPMSPYYGPLTGMHAERQGNIVTISWNPLVLRAGDDSLQYPYLIEAWLCQEGQLLFTPIGSWETMITVEDEPGCALPSHARIYGVEKHGYTLWREIPWPAP